jgi:hypothetical protein
MDKTDSPRAAEESEGRFQPRTIDPSETYNRINAKRQLNVAKAIIAEKKGVELLQKFEEEKAAYFAKKQEVSQVRQERQKELRYQQLASAEQMKAITHRMQMEERNQVRAMIRDSATRKAEQRKTEAEKYNQRQHLFAARKAFETQWMQEQKEKEAMRIAKIVEDIEEKDRKRIENRTNREAEEKAAKEEAIKNNPLLRDKSKPVEAVNKRLSKDVALDDPTQTKCKKAERLRRERLDALQRELKQKSLAVAEAKEKKKAKDDDDHHRVVEKCLEHMDKNNAKSQEQKAKQLRERAKEAEDNRTARREKFERERAAQQQELLEKLEAKDSKPRYANYVYTDDKDPHQRYIKLTAELKGQKERALVTHDFHSKSSREAEEIIKNAPYDSRLKRLDDLEEQLSKHSTTAGPSLMTARSGSTNFDQMTEQEKRKVNGVQTERCGLCEQDFTTDQLKGVTTVARIEKLRRGWMGEAGSGGVGAASSYDSVRLCVICLQLVRQHTKNDGAGK